MKLQFNKQIGEFAGTKTFIFKINNPIIWQAGQFIHLILPHTDSDDRGEERWFTIASSPYEQEIRITTRINTEKSSSFKKALQELKIGQEIETDLPKGKFILEDPSRDYIFVAGGIGITPFRSILKQLDHDGKQFHVELLYANRDENDIPFRNDLEVLSKKHKDFNITYFIGDKRIDENVLKEFGNKLDNPIYYISGPEPMVEDFEKILKHMGIDEEHSRFDYFPGYELEEKNN